MRGLVIIFLKAPVAGRVKTRLGAEIGCGRAAALFRAMTARTIARARSGPWRTRLAIDPPGAAGGFANIWPPTLEQVAQARGDLGDRMTAAIRAAPAGPVVIIGADAPGLRGRHIREAFTALGRADAVIGPAEDGGFWLIGLARRRAAPGLFAGVRWSTPEARADALASLPAGFSIETLETLTDVDDASSLRALDGGPGGALGLVSTH